MKRQYVIAALAVVGLLSGCGYNKMVSMRENVQAKWSDVESQYQRRADLVPNLVETVRGYATHERETLEAVINARARATGITASPDNMQSMQNYMQAQSEFGGAISRLLVTVESYPQLQANALFADLLHQLEGTENRINVARNDYNNAVRQYNSFIQHFPQIIYSGWFGFKKAEYFEAQAGTETAPRVDFSSGK